MRLDRHEAASAIRRVFVATALMTLLSAVAAAGPGRLLIKPLKPSQLSAIAADYSLQPGVWLCDSGYATATVAPGADLADVLRRLAADRRVEEAEADVVVVIPEFRGDQLAFAFDASPLPKDYENQAAFQQVNLGDAHFLATGRGVRIAVLDTGVVPWHSDLIGHIGQGYNALDPSRYPLDVPEGSEEEGRPCGIPNGAVGHGTMLAGILARIAPDAVIMPVKVLDADGTGDVSGVIAGIQWAMNNGADVISMSFGTTQPSPALQSVLKAIRSTGTVLVASAGNEDTDLPQLPAGAKEVIAVASVEADNTKSTYSNYGRWISLVSPGTGIRSTYWTGGYATWSGTSFSVAFVSGAAALVRELNPAASAMPVQNTLENTALSVDSVNPLYFRLLGSGLLSIEQAVLRAAK